MLMFYYQPWVLFIWGACWGSFLNVVLYRYPLGKSIVYPPSACPSCNTAIKGYDNIPIFSWFILRGKCRSCKTPYSPKYAINEALFGFVTALPVILHPEAPVSGVSLGMFFLCGIPALWLLVKHKKSPWYLNVFSLIFLAIYIVSLIFIKKISG